MDSNAIIKRVIAILTKPKEEWEVIKNEQMSVVDMYVKYSAILAAIPIVAGILGWILFVPISFGTGRILMMLILQSVIYLGCAFLLAIIIDALAPSFGAQKDMNKSLKVSIFSYYGIWISGVLFLIPRFWGIAFLAGLIYASILMFLGLQSMKESPKDKAIGFYAAVIIANILLIFIARYIVARIILGPFAGIMLF